MVIEEEKKLSLAWESRLKIVQEEKDQLEVELGDIEAAMAILMERKRNKVEKQKKAEKKVKELEEKRKIHRNSRKLQVWI